MGSTINNLNTINKLKSITLIPSDTLNNIKVVSKGFRIATSVKTPKTRIYKKKNQSIM